jgi:hypothetical protein
MIKLIRLIGRGDHSVLTHDEFINHHGSAHLVLFEQCPGFITRVQDYMQNFIVIDAAQLAPLKIPGLQTDRDSLIEVWWDSVAEMENSLHDAKYLELVRPDETSFADVAGLRDVIASEVEILRGAGASGLFKVFTWVKRATGSNPGEFRQYWQAFAERLRKIAALSQYARRFVQNYAVPLDHDPTGTLTDYDCVDEFWFDSLGDVENLYANGGWIAATSDAARAATDASRTTSVVAAERPEAPQWLRRVKGSFR